MPDITIIEDDYALNNGIALALKSCDYTINQIHRLKDFDRNKKTDIIILDINLPDGNGFDFLKKFRSYSDTPVIILTANDLETDEVTGLELGADDYIKKPFSLMVLRLRIEKILKRKTVYHNYEDEKFSFDFEKMEFYVKNLPIELSKTEQKLLKILVSNVNQVVTRDILIDKIWSDGSEYVDENAGWVRYRDVMDIINEEIGGRNKENDEFKEYKNKNLEDMKEMLSQFGSRLTDLENNQLTFEKIPTVTEEDIEKLFQDENDMSIIRNKEVDKPIVGQDNVGYIPPDSALLLVYAADGDGRIIKIRTTSSPTQIFTSGKQFMADNSKRESARWVEALDRLIEWKWVKPVGYKGEIFELTGTGYDKADWLKETMRIDTSKNPLDELKEFENFIYV